MKQYLFILIASFSCFIYPAQQSVRNSINTRSLNDPYVKSQLLVCGILIIGCVYFEMKQTPCMDIQTTNCGTYTNIQHDSQAQKKLEALGCKNVVISTAADLHPCAICPPFENLERIVRNMDIEKIAREYTQTIEHPTPFQKLAQKIRSILGKP